MARGFYDLPSLTSLAVFEATARHMSMKSAAEELNVTPGAVSRQIKALEQDIGAPLFVRVHRGIELTGAGEELAGVLAQAFGRTADVFRRVRSREDQVSVTIGATTAFASLWLMPRIGEFWRRRPEITINHMISDSPPEMRRPEVDLRIRYGNGDWPGEVGERLFGDRIYPVCGPAFAAEHPVDVDGLSALPLLHVVDAD